MADTLFTSTISDIIRRKYPEEYDSESLYDLVAVWAYVLEAIIEGSQEEFINLTDGIHIDLKPELAVELVNSVDSLGEAIVSARTESFKLSEIDPEQEREFHLSKPGQTLIDGAAKMRAKFLFDKYKERWGPKTRTKLQKEENPPKAKPRKVKSVRTNHYISKFFLRNHWAENGRLTIHSRVDHETWRTEKKPYGKWGHRKDLYSDRLEDRFSLIEGDAQKPIHKLLNLYPLNDPERLAFLGYVIVQKLRNPSYRNQLIEGLIPISTEVVGLAKANDPTFQRDAYETIFENNDLYDQISRPLLWSKWVIVRASKPVFVLPDTASILRNVSGVSIIVVPLTPTACFLTSGVPEENKRVVPHELKDDDLAELLSRSLIASCAEQFVAHPCSSIVTEGVQQDLLINAFDTIQKMVRDQD